MPEFFAPERRQAKEGMVGVYQVSKAEEENKEFLMNQYHFWRVGRNSVKLKGITDDSNGRK